MKPEYDIAKIREQLKSHKQRQAEAEAEAIKKAKQAKLAEEFRSTLEAAITTKKRAKVGHRLASLVIQLLLEVSK